MLLPCKSSVPPFTASTEFAGKRVALLRTTVPPAIDVPPLYLLLAFNAIPCRSC